VYSRSHIDLVRESSRGRIGNAAPSVLPSLWFYVSRPAIPILISAASIPLSRAVCGLHRTEYHLLGHLLQYQTADPTCLRNRLPCPQPALVYFDPIRALRYRRLPSHSASNDEPPPNLGFRLGAPGIRIGGKLTSVWTRKREAAEAFAAQFGGATTRTLDQMLSSSVDAVYICHSPRQSSCLRLGGPHSR
jgi:hypothetical protein